MKRSGFTLVELVAIIILLGILGAVAIPKMAVSREDACLVRLRGELSAMRADLSVSASKRFLKGESLDSLTIPNSIYTSSKKCGWVVDPAGKIFTPYVNGVEGTVFTIDASGGILRFECNKSIEICRKLTGN